ncbi:MAG: hypothetical protein ACM31O_13555, partial [Bacteroidota bacterium]
MSDIVPLVHQIALAIEATHPSLKASSDFDKGMAISEYMLGRHESVAQLNAAVAADESLGHLRQGWLDRGPGGDGVIQNHMLPHVFVRDALDGKAVEESLASARSFAASEKSNVDTYFPVAGVDAVEAVPLKDGLTLVPWSQVPEGNGKRWFDDASNPARRTLGSSHFVTVRPTLAIRFTERGRKVLFASRAEAYPNEQLRLTEFRDQWELSADVMRCITATAVCPSAILGSWADLDDGFANRLGGSDYRYQANAMIDLRLARPHHAIDPKIADLFQRYIAIGGEVRDVLRISLDRLALALRESMLTDRAIDLGIALETMLLHNAGEADRGELRYRAAIRGATFLGGSSEERLRTYNLLRDAYDLRSKAVHSGRIDPKDKIRKMVPAEILSNAAATCAAVARALIEREE